jgi:hypothetical protein
MSLGSPTQAGASPFTVYQASSANTAQTVTIAADTVLVSGSAHSLRQIVILTLDLYAFNGSSSAISASASLSVTTTNLNGISWTIANGFPAWTQTPLVQRFYAALEGGLFVPFVTGGGAQNAATIVIPALGANVISYASVHGVYI